MNEIQLPENIDKQSVQVTLNGRQLPRKYMPFMIVPSAAAAIVFAGAVAVVALIIATMIYGVIFVGIIACTLMALALPVIFVTDKVLKRSGRRGFITGGAAGGVVNLSIEVSSEGFKKLPPAKYHLSSPIDDL